MKKLLLFVTLCLITISINAQNEILIHKSSDIIKFNTSEIDSIKFETTENEMLIHTSSGETIIVNRSEIDSIRFIPIQEELPIVLSASTNSIIANGTEKVIFTVTQGEDNVTNESEIYVDGNLITGNKYSTLTPGSYTAYAKKNELISNEITFTAEEAPETGTTIVFAEGVSLTSGWYDVNKVKDGSYNGDINMCWAAVSANILQWWQDCYIAAGNTLPEGCPNGVGYDGYTGEYPYELAIMETFHQHWDNSLGGGWVNTGVKWYFEGGGTGLSNGAQPDPNTGGYYSAVWEEVVPTLYGGWGNGYTGEINGWGSWGSGAGYEGIDRLAKFTEFVVNIFDKGMAGLVVSMNENNMGIHHSVTLWGYEIDNATGLLTKIWIADSDDSTQWPREPKLHEYTVTSLSSGAIKFSGDSTYFPISLYPVSGYGSAE